MIDLKNAFAKPSLEEWMDQLKKDLKGDDFSKLVREDELEEIKYTTFSHAENSAFSEQVPGNYPYRRGYQTISNDWKNAHSIRVTNEEKANEKALDILMKGCDSLLFDIQALESVNYAQLLHGIQFEFIQTTIMLNHVNHYHDLKKYFNNVIPSSVFCAVDLLTTHDQTIFDAMVSDLKIEQRPFFHINGFKIQQCGATTWQEIAFCLSSGNEYLVKLMNEGLSIDEAAACIHFSMGIGSNYFYEISKIRAFRQNWAAVIKAYEPTHACTYNCSITAHIGFMNKSLQDPYTNLLRQTTETMAAAIGGVNSMVVHPYDSHSVNGTSILAERMALNISLILKEESYFDKVIDPLGGSYSIETLSKQIAEKSWELFQQLDEFGGMFNADARTYFRKQITQKANIRKEYIQTGKKTLIGVNKFHNPQTENNQFLPSEQYLDMNPIIFERDLFES